jgi:hypothetical protein
MVGKLLAEAPQKLDIHPDMDVRSSAHRVRCDFADGLPLKKGAPYRRSED